MPVEPDHCTVSSDFGVNLMGHPLRLWHLVDIQLNAAD